jgi:2-amino-4-hydroxy-6-hydroxymethyldihydropteridine diphosphokinase
MVRVGIALGSNLGDRAANLRAAVELLAALCPPNEPVHTAPFYQSQPRLCPPGSPDFLNTVIEIGVEGEARDLLAKTQEMEIRLGRVRGKERNSPRVIDIDLLYFGDEVIADGDLLIPHPGILERRFVLQPLADIRPELVLPGCGENVAGMLARLGETEAALVVYDP